MLDRMRVICLSYLQWMSYVFINETSRVFLIIITKSNINYISFTTSATRNVPKNLFNTSQIEIFLITKQMCLKYVGLDLFSFFSFAGGTVSGTEVQKIA